MYDELKKLFKEHGQPSEYPDLDGFVDTITKVRQIIGIGTGCLEGKGGSLSYQRVFNQYIDLVVKILEAEKYASREDK
jgi:hypothetical protein